MISFNEQIKTGKPEKVKLKSIKDISRIEGKKHGKKSTDFQLIQELGEGMKLSDIAIYAGMYLAKRKQKPYWTVSDLKDQLTTTTFIDDKLKPMLNKKWRGFKKLDERQKKSKALEIALNVIKNEADTITIVNDHLAATGKNVTLAHQLTKGQLGNLANIIKSIAEKMERMYGEGDDEVKKLLLAMEWSSTDKKTTTAWLNNVIKDFGAACGIALRDLKQMKDTEQDEKNLAIINSAIKAIEEQQKQLDDYDNMKILWPEGDEGKQISGIRGFVNYIRSLESYRSKAEQVINQYEKRKKAITSITSEDDDENVALAVKGWTDEKVLAYVSKKSKEWATTIGDKIYDQFERDDAAIQLAADAIKKERGLEGFLSKENADPEGELVGMFTSKLSDTDLLKGRPKTETEEEF